MATIDVRMPYMLSERHLLMALGCAFLLHIAGFVVWHYSPKQAVKDIPVRVMNIRLEEANDDAAEADIQAVNFSNAAAVDVAVNDIASKMMSPKTNAPDLPKSLENAVASSFKSTPKQSTSDAKQYVRELSTPATRTSLKIGEKGAKDAEIMSRYTQLISLWIQKFKVYPEAARLSGLEGATVVRIRIDRKGTIRYYALERSTGIEMLDKAAIDMIRRANPVPAAPNDYPKGDLLEFLIPVSFSLL